MIGYFFFGIETSSHQCDQWTAYFLFWSRYFHHSLAKPFTPYGVFLHVNTVAKCYIAEIILCIKVADINFFERIASDLQSMDAVGFQARHKIQ